MKTQRADGHVEMEAETGVILPEAKEHPRSPEAGRGQERFSPRGWRQHGPANTLSLDF